MHINKIMMIDDDPAIRRVAQISLSRVGKWEVVLVDSGFKAVEAVLANRPDAILLDIMMPGMDGLTTLKKLREAYKDTLPPIIFMTAKALRHEVEIYHQLGVAGVIIKPFDPMTLPSDILEILNGKTHMACIA